MARGDITSSNRFTDNAGIVYNVAAGVTINAGEPVARALGAAVVTAAVTATPVVGTNFFAGIALTNGTATATVAGIVSVIPVDGTGRTFTIKTSGTAYANQAAYDALVGRRVLLTLASGVYSIATAAADLATSGLVLAPLDIVRYPGRAAFRIRAAVSDLA